MEIFRTSVTLLGLCFLHSSLSETQNVCKGNLPPVQHVAFNSNVTLPCPILSAPEMVFKLYKGSEEIFSVRINNTPISKDLSNIFIVDVNNSTSFILKSVTMNTTALYTCEAEKFFPPPFQKVDHKPQTIVFVEGGPDITPAGCQRDDHLFFWVGLGVLSTYGLVMTCAFFILRTKSNTPFKERECKRKWQGVQHPTWKGFRINTVV